MDPNQQNLTDIEEQLRQLEEEISRKKAELEARRQVLLNTGGAVIQGDVDIGGGDFVNRDKYEHHHYHGGEDPATARQAEAAYRQDLAAHCDTLPLRGVDPTPGEGATGRQPLSLAQVYIALDTQRWAPAAVIAQALQRASQGQLSGLPAVSSPATTGRDEDTRPLAALEATLVHRCWVLLGKPGSGKSTFVNYLTHALAARAWEHLPGWPEGERDALPILVVLRDFARWLAGQQPLPPACADLLWRFITHELQQRKLERAAQVLEQALDQPGRAVVLLDGLDEVPPDDDRLLARVRDSVTAFAQRYHHSRHLVTCRVLSYQEPGWRLPDFEQAAAQRAEAAAFWREVILLAVGYLVHQNRDLGKPRLLVEELCPDRSPPTDSAWRQVWLAGEVLLEVGLNRIQDSAHGKGLLERVRRRLTELVETGALSARERAEAGDVLGQLDDPRFDPTRFYLPCTYRGQPEPLAGFVEIPPGPFVMGGPEDDPEDFMKNESGNPAQLTIDYPYWIAQYPVTVEQFQCFVEADGYKEQRWWTRIGWNWRNGNWFSESLGKMPRELHKEPKYWKTQLNYPNRPVVGITWFEAVAYCCWLNTQMRTTNLLTLTLEEGYVIRLPTEAEWEKAARCSGSRRYPWGNENWDLERANIKASGIDHATVVGLYRKGVTPTGLHDVSGNVWERTLSLNLRSPYDPQDGRNNLEAGGSRIVRGGCFFFDESCGRCTFRDWKPIDYFDSHGGFRVVLSLANSEF